MNGTLYGVGVGPGDPVLITLKAVRILRESSVIAIPGTQAAHCTAYEIAEKACPEIREKEILPVPMPMVKDTAALEAMHTAGADAVEACLKAGKQVAFLTLGDPTVYSTYLYIHRKICRRGYSAAIISGIPSFCAVAAKLNEGLVENTQQLHILPGTYLGDSGGVLTALQGTKVIMKTGKNMERVRKSILESGQSAAMVACCGMESEAVYYGAENFPDDPGYYALIIIKE